MAVVMGDRVAEMNLEIYRGEDFQLDVDFKQSDGTALDLTGCTAIARLKRHFTQQIATFSISITDPVSGQILISLSSDQTAQIPIASYSWDLFLVDSQEKREPKIGGTAMVYGSATYG